jgi:hypothetical protein
VENSTPEPGLSANQSPDHSDYRQHNSDTITNQSRFTSLLLFVHLASLANYLTLPILSTGQYPKTAFP